MSIDDDLPPLPEPHAIISGPSLVFTAEQMRDYARAAVAAEREACARACELEAAASVLRYKRKAVWQAQVAARCAAAIRARGEKR